MSGRPHRLAVWAACAGSNGAGRSHGRPGVRRRQAFPPRDRLQHDDAKGLELSPHDFLKDLVVQREIRDCAPKSGVFLLHIFHALGLVDLQAAILFAPAVVGLFGHTNGSRRRSCRLTASEANLHLPQFRNNLFRLGSLAHVSAPYLKPELTQITDHFSGGRPSGHKIRILTLIDIYSRYSPVIDPRFSYRGEDVVATLDRVCGKIGYPKTIRVDQGSEFVSRDLDLWAYANNVTLDFSRPGKPTDNAFIESFNGRFRAECLNQHWFMSLADAREKLEAWRGDYNTVRPHSAIGNKPPITLMNHLGETSPLR